MPDELEHISDLQHVRERPAMYFGDLSASGIANCLAREAYCLAIDQIVSGTCTRVTSDFSVDGFACVTHNGNPLGVEPDKRHPDMSEMQVVAELLGFCAERAASDYVQSDVCKNGMTALNALCERYELHNYRDGSHCMLAYARGVRLGPLLSLGVTANNGVAVRFKPDSTIVGHPAFDAVELQRWFASIPIDSTNVDVQWNDHRAETADNQAMQWSTASGV